MASGELPGGSGASELVPEIFEVIRADAQFQDFLLTLGADLLAI